MLDSGWGETGLSRKEAEVILARMDRVLGQIPDIVHQAHERIIGGRPVENSEKILSLFDRDIHVINRGKAGAEVEFGNPLFIVEQSDGMLVDFELVRGAHPGDAPWGRSTASTPAGGSTARPSGRNSKPAAITHNLWLLGRIRFDKELLKHYQREQERDKARKAGRAA